MLKSIPKVSMWETALLKLGIVHFKLDLILSDDLSSFSLSWQWQPVSQLVVTLRVERQTCCFIISQLASLSVQSWVTLSQSLLSLNQVEGQGSSPVVFLNFPFHIRFEFIFILSNKNNNRKISLVFISLTQLIWLTKYLHYHS